METVLFFQHALHGPDFDDWLPQSTAQLGSLELKTLYVPPIDERGFAIQMTVHNTSESAQDVVIGLNGCWASSWHCVNEDKPLSGKATCFRSGWNSSLIFEYHAGFPMFSFAPMADAQTDSSFTCSDDGSITYDLSHHCTIAADGTASVVFYWGLGFEEVAAATSAKEMLRQTFDAEIAKTRAWLQERRVAFNGDAKLTQLYNTNLFFCMFFSTGITLDTEELVLVTSRSPRYYVSAAYWDRDSLLWSFPAILDADPNVPKKCSPMYLADSAETLVSIHDTLMALFWSRASNWMSSLLLFWRLSATLTKPARNPF